MPSFIADPSQTLYLFLAALCIVTLAVWFSKRTRTTLIVFAVFLGLVVLVWVIDNSVETPREAAVRGVQELSEAINTREWDKFDARVSEQFNYKGLKKADIRSRMADVINQFNARTAVWEFNREKVERLGDDRIAVVFDAKGDPQSGAAYYAHFKATFVCEADGEWRLITFAVYPYASKTNGPEDTIPGIQ